MIIIPNSIKVSIPPKLIYRFSTVQVKNFYSLLNFFLTRITKAFLKKNMVEIFVIPKRDSWGY